jgi:hypothetical protein
LIPLRVIESKERLFEALLKRASLAVLVGDLENKNNGNQTRFGTGDCQVISIMNSFKMVAGINGNSL